jgi:2-keto-4-pentenoate hydratase/2-oxohepta-3-ene-1,7-dioic acid hydratase in catechol pathway
VYGRPSGKTKMKLKPSKIIGVASNYRKHIAEMGRPVPDVPKLFLMPPTALIGPGEPILLPLGIGRVDHEAELGVVIGRRMSQVNAADALDFVAGYTAVNDVSAREFQRQDGVFSRAKGIDTFCPAGPIVVSDIDPFNTRVRCWVDGVLRQDGNTSDLLFDVPTLLSFISSYMTLEPGDLISTGTPMGVGPIEPGQTVVVEVDGVGRLENPVLARPERSNP